MNGDLGWLDRMDGRTDPDEHIARTFPARTRRGLPPMWRAALILIMLTLLVAVAYANLSTPAAPEPAPSFSPVQLPTLGVKP